MSSVLLSVGGGGAAPGCLWPGPEFCEILYSAQSNGTSKPPTLTDEILITVTHRQRLQKEVFYLGLKRDLSGRLSFVSFVSARAKKWTESSLSLRRVLNMNSDGRGFILY